LATANNKEHLFVTIAVKWSNFVLCRKGKALCERPFTLNRHQPEKYKQNIDVAPMDKFLRTPIERGLGSTVALLTGGEARKRAAPLAIQM